ncbi:MAG: hypothetical protein JWQ35_2111 [Bacteriovoracaceae bacterium]|nr:hypothetical protein [Bacteriovoracaceae bacterium]
MKKKSHKTNKKNEGLLPLREKSSDFPQENEDYDPINKPAWDPRKKYPEEWKNFDESPSRSSFSQIELNTQEDATADPDMPLPSSGFSPTEARLPSNLAPRSETKVRRFFGASEDSEERSDKDIYRDLMLLLRKQNFDIDRVKVQVNDGTVILKGHVDSFLTKRRLTDSAETVLGVKEIENDIIPDEAESHKM